ncbi:MAG TPA: farnesyl diphosphate synthase [Verrucomicrobiae bacterium]|nr:farnesyl diphosphate synthase [Verrucomicrobiae bacterium]
MKSRTSFHLNRYLERVGARVTTALDSLLPPESAEPPTIHRAMRYSIFAGGKRIRPVLCLAACEAVGGKSAAAMPLACAIECIHTYSLIHDDLPCMDDDDFRRGKPTNHKVFGEGIAVLAGDALLTEAFALVAKAKPPKRYPVGTLIKELAFAAGSLRLIAGQVQDLEAENRQSALDVVKRIHLNKTAALITASIRLGAMAGDAAPAQLKRLTRYGQDLGLAFQVVDDILDATSTKEIMGKSVRADQKNQKSTFPSVLGIDKSRRFASDLIADAQAQLRGFGKSAKPLRAIADFFLTRKK